MAENIDDLTIAFYQDDRNVLKELKKLVLTRGNWTTIMYLFQELNKKTNEYEAPKVSIRRYQKRGGIYKQQSKFNISSAKQGREIARILTEWFPEGKDDEYDRSAPPALVPPVRPPVTAQEPKGPPPDDDDDDDGVTQQSDI
jgi:hypothetical protein